jgi:hypothetical protein
MQEQSLQGSFRRHSGYAYSVDFRGDTFGHALFHTPTGSVDATRFRLLHLENDGYLRRIDVGAAIVEQRKGLYSHWGDAIYPAASDHSDPK